MEDSVVEAFIELVVKLNETSFRPLFRRLYDWGFGENSGNENTLLLPHKFHQS